MAMTSIAEQVRTLVANSSDAVHAGECSAAVSAHLNTALKAHGQCRLTGLICAPEVLSVLAKALGGDVFTPSGEGEIQDLDVDPLRVDAFEHAHLLATGSFHTDYFTAPRPPRYVMIQCVRTDPRHPAFGRNQVAVAKEALAALERIAPELAHLARSAEIVLRFGAKAERIKLIEACGEGDILRLPHLHLVKAFGEASDPRVVELVEAINLACNAVMDDCVLDVGDVLVLDNHRTAHRRGEASWRLSSGGFEARSIRMMRCG